MKIFPLKTKRYEKEWNTCKKTPGVDSELMPFFPPKLAFFKTFMTAGRVWYK